MATFWDDFTTNFKRDLAAKRMKRGLAGAEWRRSSSRKVDVVIPQEFGGLVAWWIIAAIFDFHIV
jgi:hypothetical protein